MRTVLYMSAVVITLDCAPITWYRNSICERYSLCLSPFTLPVTNGDACWGNACNRPLAAQRLYNRLYWRAVVVTEVDVSVSKKGLCETDTKLGLRVFPRRLAFFPATGCLDFIEASRDNFERFTSAATHTPWSSRGPRFYLGGLLPGQSTVVC
jgi:hypothetical protein